MVIWKKFRDNNAIETPYGEYAHTSFCIQLNKLNVDEVVKALNENGVKTKEDACEFIEANYQEYFKCRTCGKDIPCKLKVIQQGNCRECMPCYKKRLKKYKDERKDLIGKKIIGVECEFGEPLRIYLDNGKLIIIADGEYGDDNSQIIEE